MLSLGACLEERDPAFKESQAGDTHRYPHNQPHQATCAPALMWSRGNHNVLPGTTLTFSSYLGAQSRYFYLQDKLKFLFSEFAKKQHLWACAARVADSEVWEIPLSF